MPSVGLVRREDGTTDCTDLASDAGIATHSPSHFIDVGVRHFAQLGYGVDGGDTLSKESVGH